VQLELDKRGRNEPFHKAILSFYFWGIPDPIILDLDQEMIAFSSLGTEARNTLCYQTKIGNTAGMYRSWSSHTAGIVCLIERQGRKNRLSHISITLN